MREQYAVLGVMLFIMAVFSMSIVQRKQSIFKVGNCIQYVPIDRHSARFVKIIRIGKYSYVYKDLVTHDILRESIRSTEYLYDITHEVNQIDCDSI